MQKPSLPSKQFLIRGGIATGIVVLILIVQTEWFLGLFNKKPQAIDPNITIGNAIAKDSNGNGIPDWEERLWGLDPTQLYTGDMSNKEIIDNKKRAMGLTVEGDEDINETDRLARQLFSIGTSLGQEGATLESINAAGGSLGTSVEIKKVTDKYFYKDVKTIKTTRTSLIAYRAKLSTIIAKQNSGTPDINLIIQAFETGDFSTLEQLKTSAVIYRQLARDFAALAVPVGVAQYHLDVINGLTGVAESFDILTMLEENGIIGLNGLAIYKQYSLKLDAALYDINNYFLEYGILN